MKPALPLLIKPCAPPTTSPPFKAATHVRLDVAACLLGESAEEQRPLSGLAAFVSAYGGDSLDRAGQRHGGCAVGLDVVEPLEVGFRILGSLGLSRG